MMSVTTTARIFVRLFRPAMIGPVALVLVTVLAIAASVVFGQAPDRAEYGGLDGGCCLPAVLGGCANYYSVSQCNSIGGVFLGEGVDCGDGTQCSVPPVPTVVGIAPVWAAAAGTSSVNAIIRAWSDGQVDRISYSATNPCNPGTVCVLVTGTCPTDVDRSGDTGINDFLQLLGGWGACAN